MSKGISKYGLQVFWKEKIENKCKWTTNWGFTKTINSKLKRKKVYTRFKENICAVDLAEMGSLFSKNKKC